MGGWLKVKNAAKYSGVSERTLRGWLKQGLRCSRLNTGSILINRAWIDEFLTSFESHGNEVDKVADDICRGLI